MGMFNEASVSVDTGPAPAGEPGIMVAVNGILPAFAGSDSVEAETSAIPPFKFDRS